MSNRLARLLIAVMIVMLAGFMLFPVMFPSDAEHAVTNTLDEDLVCIDIFAPIREDFLK